MSFDVNVLSAKPVIKAAASMQNDGGGGNLGYMQQGEKDEKEKQNQSYGSIFSKKNELDSFGFEKDWKLPDEEEKFSLQKFLADIIYSIQHLFKKK